jgi:hypothetical protein
MKRPLITPDQIVEEIGTKQLINTEEIADYLYVNYDRVTGLDLESRDDESEFPDEIYEIIDHYELDITDFVEEWGYCY